MQLQNMCKKGARIFQKNTPKGGETWQLKWHLNDGEKMIMIVDTLPVFYYEKMVGYTPSSFDDMVFTDERIKVSLKKGKFSHPAWTNEKTGANEEGENEGQAHAVTAIPIQPSFPPTQQCHYSANNKPSPYPSSSYPQRPSLKSTTKSVYRTSNDEHHL